MVDLEIVVFPLAFWNLWFLLIASSLSPLLFGAIPTPAFWTRFLKLRRFWLLDTNCTCQQGFLGVNQPFIWEIEIEKNEKSPPKKNKVYVQLRFFSIPCLPLLYQWLEENQLLGPSGLAAVGGTWEGKRKHWWGNLCTQICRQTQTLTSLKIWHEKTTTSTTGWWTDNSIMSKGSKRTSLVTKMDDTTSCVWPMANV